MNCIEFEAALEQHIETRNPFSLLSREHALTCPHCQREWQVQGQLDAAILAWRSIECSADLVDRVLSELDSPTSILTEQVHLADRSQTSSRVDSSTRISASRGTSALAASVSACLMIVVVFLTRSGERDSNISAKPQPTEVHELAVAQPSLDVSQSLSEVFSDLRSEYRDIASETKSVAMDLVNVFPRRIELLLRPDPEEIELRPTTDDVARIWRPISSRVGSALGFLWQTVPSEVPSG